LSNDEYVALGCSNDPWFCMHCLQSIFPFNHISNEKEFIMATTDFMDYMSLYFDPFIVDEKRPLLNMEDVDPDLNFYNNIAFKDAVYTLPSEIQASEFSILHANCRGLEYNFDKLQSLVDTIPTSISVIAISETWTDPNSENNYQLNGYNFEVISRRHKSCGGVGLFVNHSLRYKLRKDLCICVPDIIECIFIELELNKVIVGCLYRPPGSDLASFTAQFDTLLSKLMKKKLPTLQVILMLIC